MDLLKRHRKIKFWTDHLSEDLPLQMIILAQLSPKLMHEFI